MITMTTPAPSGARPRFNTPMRFRCESEYREYYTMLSAFPEHSLKRVSKVMQMQQKQGIRHILAAILYGRIDPHVHRLNRLIIQLHHRRSKKNLREAVEIYHHAAQSILVLRKAIQTVLTDKGM